MPKAYPAKSAYKGRGPWEKEAIRNGSPPELELGQRVYVPALQRFDKVQEYDLRIVDPPVWYYRIASVWLRRDEMEIKHG